MKSRKRRICILAAFVCLAGSLLPLQAAAAVTRVVFENEQNAAPDLYVTKRIESTSGEPDLSEDLTFTFVLKLDGELAERWPYRVFEENGKEVFDRTLGMDVPFRTDRSGTFALRPGQTARFEYLGAGTAYEVREIPREDWEQLLPAGGAPAVGTVTDKGAWAEFVNLTGGREAGLAVRKTISFPAGYEPPVSPEFPFVLELNGVPYGRKPYTITEASGGREVGSGLTDADGRFYLRGGQTAHFRKIPANVDYKVAELREGTETEGWWTIGESEKEGTTGNGGTVFVNFTNSNTSFAVTKRLEDDSRPDTEFLFLLTHGDYSVWTGAAYHLYETGGMPILDEKGVPVSGVTDKDGHFALRPGQAALFTGIEPGTIYHVSEVGRADYIQLVPGTARGYTGREVTAGAEILPFVNRSSEEGLTVTKVLKHITGDAPMEQKEFHFFLSRKVDDGYRVMAYADYCVETGTSRNTYQTAADGSFMLRANETARFAGLPDGEYRVEEADSCGPEYTPEDPVQYGTLTMEKRSAGLIFINQYCSKFLDLRLYKVNRREEPLAGAKFMLYRDEQLKNPVQPAPYETTSAGELLLEDLKPGTYYLEEVRAPAGYRLPANPVQLEVTWGTDGMKTRINGEETNRIYNSRNFTLPATGGGELLLLTASAAGMFFLFLAVGRQCGKNFRRRKRLES